MREKKLQTQIIKHLKGKGCYVIKTKPQPGIPVGCPDIIALYKNTWIAIEVKKARGAKYETGQEATLEFLSGLNAFVWTVYPENWENIKIILDTNLFDIK